MWEFSRVITNRCLIRRVSLYAFGHFSEKSSSLDAQQDQQQEEGGFKTIGEALRGIRQLRMFMRDKGIQDDGLDNIEDRILAKSGEICQQTEITDFLNLYN